MRFPTSPLRVATFFLFAFAGLPLAIYPVVAIADIMSLVGYGTGEEPLPQVLSGLAAVLLSLFYPVAYFLCMRWTARNWQNPRAAILGGLSAILYLVITVASFGLWFVFGD